MISNIQTTFVRGGLVCQQVATLALDTIYLAGKLTTKIPVYITKSALLGLSFTGLLSIQFQGSLIQKTFSDTKHGYKTGQKLIMVTSAIKTSYVTIGVLLTNANLAAAIAGLCGKDTLQMEIYKTMIPMGEATIGMQALLELVGLYLFRKILKQKKLDEEAFEKALAYLDPHKAGWNKLASEIRFCMDKDTLNDLINNFSEQRTPIQATYTAENIELRQRFALKGGILLSLIGYTLMGVEKYYTPNSIESAVINESVALLYALNVAIQLWREVPQRQAIKKAAGQPLLYPNP